MKRIAMLAGSVALGMASLLGPTIGIPPFPTMRASPTPGKRRHAGGGKRRIGRSKYMPHIGAKEQERAKRCRMTRYFSEWSANPRVAPTMQQMSKATARRVGA